jgi:hypothetical protein
MAATNVIGLWLDESSDPDGDTVWIVSRDTMNSKGQAETTRTVATYSPDDYADARLHAEELALHSDLCVIETQADQSQECIYQPEGAINPLATGR